MLSGLEKRVVEALHAMLAQGRVTELQECKILGTYLFNALFDDKDIKKEIENILDEVEREKDTTLFRLVLDFKQDAAKLAELPWEYIFYPQDDYGNGIFIATRTNLILSRYVPNRRIKGSWQPIEKPLVILLVVSQPKDDDLGKVDPSEVIRTLKDLKKDLPVEIKILSQPTDEEFRKQVNEHRPHVLHFIGHGKYDKNGGHLLFVGEKEVPFKISETKFASYFIDYQPRLIFLHCCEGAHTDSYEAFRGVALQLVYSSKVSAVVAMQYQVENIVASKFARKFYSCIAECKPVDVAAQEGRKELYDFLQEEKSYSRRAYGSPVVFLQSPEAILVDKITKLSSNQALGEHSPIPCPNRSCPAKVLKVDRLCAVCRHQLGNCPKCSELMSVTIGICVRCGYDTKNPLRDQLESDHAKVSITESQKLRTTSEEK